MIESIKCYWNNYIIIFIIISNISLLGCSNKFNTSINAINYDNIKNSNTNSNTLKNIIYRRNYKNIKNKYIKSTYQVKPGDTLFYISWITGNNYKELAEKNKILKPYIIKVGQILKVNHSEIHSLKKNVFLKIISLSIKNFFLKKDTFNIISNNMQKTINKWQWPTTGKIINKFSIDEGGNKGIDISGFPNQPILAAASGKVVYVGNALKGYGNLIIIKHSHDYLSAYAHNNKILVFKQQKVKTGQKIATMGNSGGVNTIKLHFEIRHKGRSVNPINYLP